MTATRKLRWTGGVAATAAVTLLVLALDTAGQQVRREGFETRETQWIKGTADGSFRELEHQMTEETAHSGQRSESIKLQAEQGSFIHYYFETGRAPLGEDWSGSVWVKANRPGVQVIARLVLPHETNPKQPEEPLTTLLRGDLYKQAGRWQRLEIRQPAKLAKEQQQLLRTELNRDVNLADAYVDRLVLNLHPGPGAVEVWIDDLEIGPIADAAPFRTTSRPVGRDPIPTKLAPNRAAVVELKQEQLLVSGKKFFFRAIRHTDTPLKVLRDAGFNTIWLDDGSPSEVIDEAVNQGFWVIPGLTLPTGQGDAPPVDALARSVAAFVQQDAVLFWDVGKGGLLKEQVPYVSQAARLVHAADPNRPVAADVFDGMKPYSRNLQLLGIHRWPLLTGLELPLYREWLNQRRLLAEPGTFVWTWVQTHLPDWYSNLVYDKPGAAGFNEPIGPQPEQIRLLTYIALASGCKGLGFWSDRFLAASHQGYDRMLGMALLNQELQMLEPLLVNADPPTLIDTSLPQVKAAVLRSDKGILVLPIWMGPGSQYVPGQAAAALLTITVPQVPRSMVAWLATPGEVRSLDARRTVGGTAVEIRDFGLTSAVVFTSDTGLGGLIIRLQDLEQRNRKLAAQWSLTLADVELDKVSRVYAELERMNHGLPDGLNLLADCRERLQRGNRSFNNHDYTDAYREAQVALRPLRILMRACWETAVRDLDSPVSSPYAVSFFTLPRHWRFMEQARQTVSGANALPDGGFEQASDRPSGGWGLQEDTLDDVEMTAHQVTDDPKEGRQCLMLEIKPRATVGADGKPLPPPAALERTYLAFNSPTVRLPPGSLARVSGWVRVPKAITASADGVLFYDSAGGEPLAVRLTGEVKKWKQFSLIRRVPASGTINVTLALTGIGSAFFDDVRIEPLTASRGPVTAAASPVPQRN